MKDNGWRFYKCPKCGSEWYEASLWKNQGREGKCCGKGVRVKFFFPSRGLGDEWVPAEG